MTAASRYRCCARRCAQGAVVVAALTAAAVACAQPPLADAPVIWYAGDDRPIPVPAEYDPELIVTEIDATISQPIARNLDPVRWLAGVPAAADVNALDEVLESTWFTNRMGLHRLSAAELATGPGAEGPDRSGPWEIIGAKTGGVTAGFRIRDARGQVWLLKFDHPDRPGQSIRAGVVSNLILHACGYNTPVDRLVSFDREQLRVGAGASLRTIRGLGGDLRLTEANLDSVLQATNSVFGGRYHCLASRFLQGIPLGPITHHGTRPDDPNDTVPHEDRRVWRALKVFCAWIDHVDMKIQNSLAMYVGEPGQGHVEHYLIDFATTLGASGAEPFAKFGYEYGIDLWATTRRLTTLGLTVDDWQQIAWPEHLSEVGYFSADRFEPQRWQPISPHAAMARLTDRDGYWAAKIVSAFTDTDLRVILEQGRYQDPRAVDYLVEHLGRRRDLIARHCFDRVAPLDYFRVDADALVGRDLGAERGIYPGLAASYQWRCRPVRADRSSDRDWSPWTAAAQPSVPLVRLDAMAGAPPPGHRFLAVQWRLRRGEQRQGPLTVYLRGGDRRPVAVDR
jgi:hypothetical protein